MGAGIFMNNKKLCYRQKGFLIREGNKYKIDSEKTTSILMNQLQIDILEKNKQYFNGKLLDAGCGEKPYSILYDDLVNESIGCDVEICIHDQRSVDVFASVDELPFSDKEFDTILCTNVLEHVSNMEKGVSELSRCLKEDGNLILITPFLYPTHEAPYDFYRYTIYGLKHQLEKNKMKVVKIIPLGGVGFFLMVYFNIFLSKVIKNGVMHRISVILQNVFYGLYKRCCFEKICNGVKGINGVISCGYFVVAQKEN